MANIIIYSMFFIIGTLLGSFFTLAIHRIPLKQNITHERSYCPKCNHKLNFLDLIPILSYLFLGGKCRYCKNKIRPRYLILEILSGMVFLFLVLSLNINIFSTYTGKYIYLLFLILYISTLIIVGGIDKEKNEITNSVMIFGFIIEIMYITYLYILEANMYRYIIYLTIIIILALLNKLFFKKTKGKYTIQILILCFFLAIATKEEITILSIITTLFLIAIKIFINKIKKKQATEKIPVGFYLCFSNVAILIIQNFLCRI